MAGIGIRAEIRTFEARRKTHAHDFVQAVLPLRGKMEMAVGHHRSCLQPTNAIIIFLEEIHEFESSRSGEFLVLDFDDPEMVELISQANDHRTFAVAPITWRYMQFLANELRLSSLDIKKCRSILSTAINLLTQQTLAISATSQPIERINEAATLLSDSGDIQLKISEIAKRVGMSNSTMKKHVKKHYGKSPKRLQLDYKFDRAMQLLTTTSQPVSSIAYEMGYENVSSFTNSFRKRYGMTPSDFRKSKK